MEISLRSMPDNLQMYNQEPNLEPIQNSESDDSQDTFSRKTERKTENAQNEKA